MCSPKDHGPEWLTWRAVYQVARLPSLDLRHQRLVEQSARPCPDPPAVDRFVVDVWLEVDVGRGVITLQVDLAVLQVLTVGFEGGKDLPDPRDDRRDKIGFAVDLLERPELADLADGKQADIR